jgi:hypothetical protein
MPLSRGRRRFLLKDYGRSGRNLLVHHSPASCLEDTGFLVYALSSLGHPLPSKPIWICQEENDKKLPIMPNNNR